MLSTSIQIRDEASKTLEILPDELKGELSKALLRSGQKTADLWKLALTGRGSARTLAVRSGALRRSIRSAREGPSAVRVGTNLRYGRAHEFGVNKTVPVRSHTRGDVEVRPHLRNMRLPPRPHRAPAFKAAGPVVEAIFAGRVDDSVEIAARQGKLLARWRSIESLKASRPIPSGRT